ncbi:hypothetical protein WN55_00761 [Dufourea novaeangliae]|uniref:DUF659 domain-containing protein n=2 Tax=Dufourea novaeangliae TaxID=178035 RepID=A0A154PB50_DUFNO|nr:hypothetical protein WN55_00761 [Dufourea novaeangliae]
MEDRHSGENLAIIFNMINEEWNISGKVNAMVHDNAYNITMAADLSDDVRYNIPCAAHTTQLCARDALSSVDRCKEVIQKGSKIIQQF